MPGNQRKEVGEAGNREEKFRNDMLAREGLLGGKMAHSVLLGTI